MFTTTHKIASLVHFSILLLTNNNEDDGWKDSNVHTTTLTTYFLELWSLPHISAVFNYVGGNSEATCFCNVDSDGNFRLGLYVL